MSVEIHIEVTIATDDDDTVTLSRHEHDDGETKTPMVRCDIGSRDPVDVQLADLAEAFEVLGLRLDDRGDAQRDVAGARRRRAARAP